MDDNFNIDTNSGPSISEEEKERLDEISKKIDELKKEKKDIENQIDINNKILRTIVCANGEGIQNNNSDITVTRENLRKKADELENQVCDKCGPVISSVRSQVVEILDDLEVRLENNKNEIEKQKIASRTDIKTGALNYCALQADLTKNIIDSNKFNKLNSIAILDIDLFKKLNDNFGHVFGDFILKVFVEKLQNFIDLTNVSSNKLRVYRFGGEEFVLLSSMTEVNLKKFLDRFLNEFSEIEHSLKGKKTKVTFSGGIVAYKSSNYKDLIDSFQLRINKLDTMIKKIIDKKDSYLEGMRLTLEKEVRGCINNYQKKKIEAEGNENIENFKQRIENQLEGLKQDKDLQEQNLDTKVKVDIIPKNMTMADKALYKSKEGGRRLITIFRES